MALRRWRVFMIKLNGDICLFKYYNDGSTRASIDVSKCYVDDNTITWLYDNTNEEILELYYLVNHLHEHNFNHIILNLPYVVNARQDRVKSDAEIFTLKYFANLINSLNFDKVRVFDPHSYVSTALINHVEVEMPIEEITTMLNKYSEAILCFTDEGGYKRYHSYFNTPFVFGMKERNWETQKIESLQIAGAKHMIAGHDIIICDDIVSRGSTLYLTAKTLKEMGANKIYVWVSHCENTVLGSSLLDYPDLIEKIYTTNSIYRADHPKIEIIKKF